MFYVSEAVRQEAAKHVRDLLAHQPD